MTTSQAIRSQRLMPHVVITALPMLVSGLLALACHELHLLWFGIPLSVGLCLAYPALHRRAVLMQSRNIYMKSGAKFCGPRVLRIEDKGLYSSSAFEEKTMFWDSFSDVVVNETHCIVCVSDVAVLAIAKDSVQAGDFDDFTSELSRRWSQARVTNSVAEVPTPRGSAGFR